MTIDCANPYFGLASQHTGRKTQKIISELVHKSGKYGYYTLCHIDTLEIKLS